MKQMLLCLWTKTNLEVIHSNNTTIAYLASVAQQYFCLNISCSTFCDNQFNR